MVQQKTNSAQAEATLLSTTIVEQTKKQQLVGQQKGTAVYTRITKYHCPKHSNCISLDASHTEPKSSNGSHRRVVLIQKKPQTTGGRFRSKYLRYLCTKFFRVFMSFPEALTRSHHPSQPQFSPYPYKTTLKPQLRPPPPLADAASALA
jgi:hypothetical protein